MIGDLSTALVHSSQLQGPEVYVPEPIADFLEADIFTREGVGDADPALLPSDAAVAADEADFEGSRILKGREAPRQLAL